MKARLVLAAIAVILCAAGAAAVVVYLTGEMTGARSTGEAGASGSQSMTEGRTAPDGQVILSLGEDEGEISISWSGRETGPGILRAAPCGEALSSAEEHEGTGYRILGSDLWRYHVKLENLTPGRTYCYEIAAPDEDAGDARDGQGRSEEKVTGSFTVPDPSGEVKFLYLGDVQFEKSTDEYEEWGEMTERILQENPDLDFAVIGGDMVNSPTEIDQWEAFLRSCRVFSRLPLMTVSGNHEGVRANKTYQMIFDPLTGGPGARADETGEALEGEFYSFDYGICRFVMMDSSFLTEERREDSGEAEWNRQEKLVESWLGSTLSGSVKTWKIAVVHHPVYGFHDRDTVSPQIRRLWKPLLEDGGVSLVFSGHQHMYMRTKEMGEIVYVMGNSGPRTSDFYDGTNSPAYAKSVYSGANYQIVTASKSRLRMTSYSREGRIIDDTVITRPLSLR